MLKMDALPATPSASIPITIALKPGETLPELPAGSLGRDLAAWCEELVQETRGTRQRVLQLFALATPLRLIESWASWWGEARRLLRAAGEARALPYHKETWNRLRARVEALGASLQEAQTAHAAVSRDCDVLKRGVRALHKARTAAEIEAASELRHAIVGVVSLVMRSSSTRPLRRSRRTRRAPGRSGRGSPPRAGCAPAG